MSSGGTGTGRLRRAGSWARRPAAALLAGALAAAGPAGALQAGATRVDLTPAPAALVPMCGYARFYEHPAAGLHDSLWARVVVLDDGARRVALVSVDLIGLNVDADPGPGRLAQRLRDQGLDAWLVVSTHTHGGPRTLDLAVPYAADRSWGGDPPYTTWAEDRIVDGVVAAVAALRPVEVRAGDGAVDLSFNRRRVLADGSWEMIWGRYESVAGERLGPTDPEVGVVRLDDLAGRPVAVLVSYACHAVVLGAGNAYLTADFPGYAMAYLEDQLPGAVALFLQGGAGDLDPKVDVQDSFAPAQAQGQVLGAEAARVALALEATPPLEDAPRLDWVRWQRPFRLNRDPEQRVAVGYGLLRLGRSLAFGALPGEPFVDLQLDLKARSPVPHTYLLGYTNGYVGYLPTLAAHREGGYGADTGDTFQIEPAAGEAMVEDLVAELVRGVWTQPLPDTLRSGVVTELRGRLQPPGGDGVTVTADLSDLGGPARADLTDLGPGGFALTGRVGPDLVPGRRRVRLFLQTGDGPPQPYVTVTVTVLPGQDWTVLDPAPAPGWRAAAGGRLRLEGTASVDGIDGLACRAEPYDVWRPADFWTLDLVPQEAADLTGFDGLRFLFHPGDLAAAPYPAVHLRLGGCRLDLASRVDVEARRWQPVDVDLGDLDCGMADGGLRLWGWGAGTFHLARMSFTLGPPPATAVAGGVAVPAADTPALEPSFPNPFNAGTVVPVVVPAASPEVEVAVFDLLGQRQRTLHAGPLAPGRHRLRWDGRDADGRPAASGVYLCRLVAGDGVRTRRLLLLR